MAQCAVPVGISPHSASAHRILLGRDPELGDLDVALDDVVAGRGRVVLAKGEPGIGKSRLADELGRKAAARGFAVHWGRAWEAGGAPSYWPVIQTLRSVWRSFDREALEASLATYGDHLAGLIPEVRRIMPGLSTPTVAADADRFALFDAVGGFLRAAATRVPQLIVLDDLHAADPSSLLLL